MTPIFSNNTKTLKSSVQNGTGTFVIEKQYLQWKPYVVFLISHMWCYDAYFVTNMSLWRHNDVIRVEIRVIAPHMRNQNNYIFDLCRFAFSPLRIHILFSRLNTPEVWPCMVMWREIWISLITCHFAPFYPIEMGFSPEIIEFYVENYY